MPEPQPIDNGALADYNVLVDEVTDATLGTGLKQMIGLMDATIGSTTKIVAGGGVEAGALRVTVASDSTGVLSVDDNGASITVDGAVTVTNATAANLKAEVVGTGTFAVQAALTAGTNTNEVVGDAAHDAAIAGNPVRIAGRALTADYTAVAAGDTADLITSILGKLVVLPYSLPGQAWKYAAASGGIVNTTAVTIKAAGAAGVVNYLTHISVINGHASVSTEVVVRDGAAGTVIWRGFAQAAGGGVAESFVPPLASTAATLLEVACITTGSAVYVNAQGYSAAE